MVFLRTRSVSHEETIGTSSQLQRELRRIFLSYPVLDALQGQFLAQFIEVERLRYMNLGKAPKDKILGTMHTTRRGPKPESTWPASESVPMRRSGCPPGWSTSMRRRGTEHDRVI